MACPILGVSGCSMKSAGKFLAWVTALYLFGGVLNSTAHVARRDQELPQGNQNTGQPGTMPSGVQGEAEEQGSEAAGPRRSSPVSQSNSVGIREPPFPKHVLLFGPDSAEPSAESRNAIKRAASWLREHREVRILVVGFCDPSGSEVCTHALAERRATVVGQLLVNYGVGSWQIVAEKGWDKADPVCVAATHACRAMNRRARIFIAGPVHKRRSVASGKNLGIEYDGTRKGCIIRGSIREPLRKQRCAFILGEGGCETHLDRSALNGTEFTPLAPTVSELVPNEVGP